MSTQETQARVHGDTKTEVQHLDAKFFRPPRRKTDIEHAQVSDDPRKWSRMRKAFVLFIISGAATVAGLGTNIYNPAIAQIKSDLNASNGQISLSLSLYIMMQGSVPLIWCAISEIHGRKNVYLSSLAICIIGCIVSATAKNIQILIGMRCLQALGSSAVISLGASTLADIYDPHERGTMMGIYYCAPLLGPALGPILGGALAQSFGWRSLFWFLAIFTSLCFFAFVCFKDTFRRERSLVYQTTLTRIRRQREEMTELAREKSEAPSRTLSRDVMNQINKDSRNFDEKRPPNEIQVTMMDLESQRHSIPNDITVQDLKLSLKDIDLIKPIVIILSGYNNVAILLASALTFAFNYSISYTCSRTLFNKYNLDSLQIGLVLLTFGAGGRWSDYVFTRVKAQNGGTSTPEMRLKSTQVLLPFLPACVVSYGWVSEKHLSLSVICAMLFLSGFFCISVYASTLAYIVDANVGRSSSAAATNACFRGIAAFAAAEAAVPLQVAIGDGGTYSLWAGLLIIAEGLILLVWWKGESWREKAEQQQSQRRS
ncbi:hypothetical protein NLI96_g912 [Meripilus lineatus]|uniref:Major facilitator superfamily (MFS) profile domain-containing protein n=1 Tax=Meripilus lineatus TaxID=2056292 RepID=A0AAD5VBE9_9APHY|nr:hypothetical protein NLI96_g912 [Physisporinus lineatus]